MCGMKSNHVGIYRVVGDEILFFDFFEAIAVKK
jgi:hypothetical protein